MRSPWATPLDSYDARRENAERYAEEDRDDLAERDADTRDRWQHVERGVWEGDEGR